MPIVLILVVQTEQCAKCMVKPEVNNPCTMLEYIFAQGSTIYITWDCLHTRIMDPGLIFISITPLHTV